MIFETETYAAKAERLRNWHRWFAWHPVAVPVSEHRQKIVWLQYVYRRRELHWDMFMYFYALNEFDILKQTESEPVRPSPPPPPMKPPRKPTGGKPANRK